jgi:HEAT repeat protein
MNRSVWRLALVFGTAMLLAACGNKETKEALSKSDGLAKQKEYQDANQVLVAALQAREDEIRGEAGTPTDAAANDALRAKVKSDPEILKMERSQLPLYLHLERADMASAVYGDIAEGDPKDTVIYDLLNDPDADIRAGAVRVLGLVGKPEAIAALAKATKDSDQDVRRAAVNALGAIKDDPDVVPPLIDALKDSYWFVRSEAASALGQEHDGRAVKPLLDTTGDSDKTVQEASALALLAITKDPAAHVTADDFVSRLTDANPKVVLVSAICLALLKDKRSIPVLEGLIATDDPVARLDAVKGLGETGDPSVIPMLRVTLKSDDMNMRGWSIIGLGNLKDEGSLADLQVIAGNTAEPDAIRSAASDAITKITGQSPPAPAAAPAPSAP